MKKLIVFGLAVVFFVVPLGCGLIANAQATTPEQQGVAPASTEGSPTLEISETFFDFGRMSEGNDYIHAFKLKNTGTSALVIRKILPG